MSEPREIGPSLRYALFAATLRRRNDARPNKLLIDATRTDIEGELLRQYGGAAPPGKRIIEQIVAMRGRRGLRLLIRELMALYGLEIAPSVEIGQDLILGHRGFGTVIHPRTTIGDRARIYHHVTVGRLDSHRPGTVGRIEIGNDVILFPGAVVLGDSGVRRVADGTVVGANAVLTADTGLWEIWAGNPARKVGERDPADHT